MRKLSFVVATLVAVSACTEEKKPEPKVEEARAAPTPPPAPPPPLTGEALAAHYEKCWAAWNARSWDALGACYADAATSRQVGYPQTTGKTAVVEAAKAYATGFPDSKGTLQLVLVNDRDVTSVVHFMGTHTGSFRTPAGEIPATGNKVGYLGTHHVKFDDQNRVTEETWVFDSPTLMAQLGLNKEAARPMLEKGWAETPEVVVAKADDAEKANVAAFMKSVEMWNARDKGFGDMLADDVVMANTAMPADVKGKKALVQHDQAMFKSFSDARVEASNARAAGGYTVATVHFKATNDGAMGKMRKTGKSVDMEGMEIVAWKDGKMAHDWIFMNGMQMAEQLGLVPPAGKDMKVGAVEK